MTHKDIWLNPPRPCVASWWAFKDRFLAEAREQMFRPEAMDVYRIDWVAHLPMPPSWSKKKRAAMNNTPHRQVPDRDNIDKAICDALLEDDSGVWSGSQQKYWGDEPGLDLIIYYEVLL